MERWISEIFFDFGLLRLPVRNFIPTIRLAGRQKFIYQSNWHGQAAQGTLNVSPDQAPLCNQRNRCRLITSFISFQNILELDSLHLCTTDIVYWYAFFGTSSTFVYNTLSHTYPDFGAIYNSIYHWSRFESDPDPHISIWWILNIEYCEQVILPKTPSLYQH